MEDAPREPQIECNCPDGLSYDTSLISACNSCGALQHIPCTSRLSEKYSSDGSIPCRSCARGKIEELQRLQDHSADAQAGLKPESALSHAVAAIKPSKQIDDQLKKTRTQLESNNDSEMHETRDENAGHPPQVGRAFRSRHGMVSQDMIDRPDFICHCAERPPSGAMHLFMCEDCTQIQHEECSTGNSAFGETSPLLCNECKSSQLEQLIAGQQAQVDKLRVLVHAKREAADKLYSKVLWRAYCTLPNGAAPLVVMEATRTEYYRGEMVPVFPAPQDWIDEVRRRVSNLMNAAGNEVSHFAMGPGDPDGGCDEKILVPWGQLAVWAVHKGPLKGRRSDLGVLAELVGLEKKGTYWKGGSHANE